MHEASLHEFNCFITLTYDPEHVPPGGTLVKKHFQDFMKRVRKRFSVLVPGKGKRKKRQYPALRFYMCGEYGETLGRPHYHACLFGIDFPDKYKWRTSPSGHVMYRSDMLESLWKYGSSEIGDVTFESAAYVARYVMKKITGDDAVAHYGDRLPEYCQPSLKPALGKGWVDRWSEDVLNNDFILVNGKKCRVPRYYAGELEVLNDRRTLVNRARRAGKARDRVDESDNARRALAKIEVFDAKMKRLKKEI